MLKIKITEMHPESYQERYKENVIGKVFEWDNTQGLDKPAPCSEWPGYFCGFVKAQAKSLTRYQSFANAIYGFKYVLVEAKAKKKKEVAPDAPVSEA